MKGVQLPSLRPDFDVGVCIARHRLAAPRGTAAPMGARLASLRLGSLHTEAAARNKWPPAQPNQPCCRAHLNAGIDPATGIRYICVNSWETGGTALSPGSDPHLHGQKHGEWADQPDGKAIREGKCRRLPAGAHEALQPLPSVTHTTCRPAAATRQPARLHHAAHQHVGGCVGSLQEERPPAVPLAGILV